MAWAPSTARSNPIPYAHRTTVFHKSGTTTGPSEGNLVPPDAHPAPPPTPGPTEQQCSAGVGNLSLLADYPPRAYIDAAAERGWTRVKETISVQPAGAHSGRSLLSAQRTAGALPTGGGQ